MPFLAHLSCDSADHYAMTAQLVRYLTTQHANALSRGRSWRLKRWTMQNAADARCSSTFTTARAKITATSLSVGPPRNTLCSVTHIPFQRAPSPLIPTSSVLRLRRSWMLLCAGHGCFFTQIVEVSLHSTTRTAKSTSWHRRPPSATFG